MPKKIAKKNQFTESAPQEEKGHVRFRVYKDEVDEWRWQLKARNGRIIGDSGEGYKNKKDMVKSMDLIRKAFGDNTVEDPQED